ncbi:MAG: cation:proton antiporter, partial [Hyphomicrobiales bacterium]|nr:cation:proton antiporter [Hyphomicrobiales bacterium]MCY4039330.1 cation:proton antiporter [Hyphomicrobiales bacterium]
MEHAKDVVGGIPYVKEAIIFLMATVAIVPLFHHLRASPVLGYLFVGALIGPFGLQIVAHAEGVHVIAELGVVFLLFAIGLELSLTRLRAMRRILFGLGGLQVLVSGAVIGGVAYLWGVSERAAIVIGVALALSSTAVVVQLLVERGAFALPVGRTSFAILLLQDLAVVPLLALIGALGGAATESIYPTLGAVGLKTIFVILLIFLIGGWAMRFLFPFIANTRNPELLTALALLAILGAASLTRAAGLSMGLGAFLIGLLLAESEFRHQ